MSIGLDSPVEWGHGKSTPCPQLGQARVVRGADARSRVRPSPAVSGGGSAAGGDGVTAVFARTPPASVDNNPGSLIDVVSQREFPTVTTCADAHRSRSVDKRGLFDGDAYRSTIRKTQVLPWGWCLVCTAGNSASLAQRHPDRSGRLAGARSRCCAPAVPARSSRPPPVACFSRPPDFVKGGCLCGGRGPMSARQLFRDRASSGSVPAGVPENFSR